MKQKGQVESTLRIPILFSRLFKAFLRGLYFCLKFVFRDPYPFLKAFFRDPYPCMKACLGIPILLWKPISEFLSLFEGLFRDSDSFLKAVLIYRRSGTLGIQGKVRPCYWRHAWHGLWARSPLCRRGPDNPQLWAWTQVHPFGVLRNLLISPRPLDFLSSYKKLFSTKGLGWFLRASWHMMPISKRSDDGLGFLTTYCTSMEDQDLSTCNPKFPLVNLQFNSGFSMTAVLAYLYILEPLSLRE